MLGYTLRRIIYGLVVIAGITVFVFVTLRLIPGDVIELQLAEASNVDEQQIADLTERFGLSEPLHVQLGMWVAGALTGDLGESFWTQEPVAQMVAERLPRTLQLGVMAIVIGVLAGIPMGVASAVRKGSWVDNTLRVTAVAGLSVPNFFIGLLLVTYLGIWFSWSPPLLYQGPTEDLAENLQQTVLPALALSTPMMASVARMTRSSMLETLGSNAIRTVRAKGAGPGNVIYKHALRNSLISVFTVVGLQVGGVLGGTVLLESVFAIPGLGALTFEAVNERDYPVVVACVLVYSFVFVAVNIVVDLCYGLIDPRIRNG